VVLRFNTGEGSFCREFLGRIAIVEMDMDMFGKGRAAKTLDEGCSLF